MHMYVSAMIKQLIKNMAAIKRSPISFNNADDDDDMDENVLRQKNIQYLLTTSRSVTTILHPTAQYGVCRIIPDLRGFKIVGAV